MNTLNIRWLGYLPYGEALTLQRGFHTHVSSSKDNADYLLLMEHNSVITKGRKANKENVLETEKVLNSRGIKVHEVDRGGDVTFHGKGQLIGYPIIRLSDPKKVIPYVKSLEKVLINTLKEFEIEGFQKENATGVWTKKGKIASIGIKVSKWTTLHGFALNIHDNIDGFSVINPCGFDSTNIKFNCNFVKFIYI